MLEGLLGSLFEGVATGTLSGYIAPGKSEESFQPPATKRLDIQNLHSTKLETNINQGESSCKKAISIFLRALRKFFSTN